MELRKPINLEIHCTTKRKRDRSGKLQYTNELIYTLGNEYSYDENGNAYGNGVFYTHASLIKHISALMECNIGIGDKKAKNDNTKQRQAYP